MTKRRNHKWIEMYNPMGSRTGWWCRNCGYVHDKHDYPAGKNPPCDTCKESTKSNNEDTK